MLGNYWLLVDGQRGFGSLRLCVSGENGSFNFCRIKSSCPATIAFDCTQLLTITLNPAYENRFISNGISIAEFGYFFAK